MKQQKTTLNLIGWDSASDNMSSDESNNNNNDSNSQIVKSITASGDSDLKCSASLLDSKSIRISLSDILQLKYNSTVA